MEGLVDLAAIDAFLAFHHGKESPVVAILAMYDTFDRGCEKSGARIVCCAPTLGYPMRGAPLDESITPFIARGFSDHNARVLQGVRKAWDAA